MDELTQKTREGRTQRVLAPPAAVAVFLVLTIRAGAEEAARELLADVAGLTRAVGFRRPTDDVSCVVGIGADLWDRLYDLPRPAGLHPFQPLRGDRHSAPSTPGDLLFHLRASRQDPCFELAQALVSRLAGSADVVDEVHGFRYFDMRDLLGFVDGTENPEGPDAVAAVTIGSEDPAYAGGSYVIVQKYLHDLDAWNALPVEEQERAFGRHKLSDLEFPDEQKASNSHLVLNTIEDPDGTERQIFRDNMNFGRVGSQEFGTYFIGYAATPTVIEQMLQNMFCGSPAGNHDRILDFSTALTGGLFFVPTQEFLEDPDAATETQTETQTGAEGSSPAPPDDHDGSLSVGSLKRTRPGPDEG